MSTLCKLTISRVSRAKSYFYFAKDNCEGIKSNIKFTDAYYTFNTRLHTESSLPFHPLNVRRALINYNRESKCLQIKSRRQNEIYLTPKQVLTTRSHQIIQLIVRINSAKLKIIWKFLVLSGKVMQEWRPIYAKLLRVATTTNLKFYFILSQSLRYTYVKRPDKISFNRAHIYPFRSLQQLEHCTVGICLQTNSHTKLLLS